MCLLHVHVCRQMHNSRFVNVKSVDTFQVNILSNKRFGKSNFVKIVQSYVLHLFNLVFTNFYLLNVICIEFEVFQVLDNFDSNPRGTLFKKKYQLTKLLN